MDNDNPKTHSSSPADIDLTVFPQEVEAVPGISELIESIQTYVTPANPANSAENVAIIFAAVLLALRASGVQTERTGNRSQHFSYMYRGESYRILLSARSFQAPIAAKPSVEAASKKQKGRRGSKGKRQASAAAQEACRRHAVFLWKLFKKQYTVAQASLLMLCNEAAGPGSIAAEHEGSSNFTAAAIRDVLGHLRDL